MKFLFLIWSAVKRKKLRSLFTVLSIMVAFILFCLLSAVESAFTQGVELAGADRLVIRHKVSLIQLLPQSYHTRIQSMEGVTIATHLTWFGGYYQDPRNFFAQMPVIPEEFLEVYPEFILTDEEIDAWKRTRTGAIVGRASADRYGWKVGDRVPIFSSIWRQKDGNQTWEFDIVGIFDGSKKGTDTTPLYFRYDYFDEARANAEGEVGWFVAKVDNPDEAPQVAQAIDDAFANSPYETKAETEGAFVQGFANQIGNIGAIMISVLSTVFFTILLVAGNTMAQAVRERIMEIGVLKAIGFDNNRILFLILGESCFLAALGGGIGLAIGWLITSAGDPTNGMLPTFYLPTERLILGGCFVLALGIVAGLWPAVQGGKLKVAEALRRH